MNDKLWNLDPQPLHINLEDDDEVDSDEDEGGSASEDEGGGASEDGSDESEDESEDEDEDISGRPPVDGTATGWTLSPEKLIDLVVELYGILPEDLPNGTEIASPICVAYLCPPHCVSSLFLPHNVLHNLLEIPVNLVSC